METIAATLIGVIIGFISQFLLEKVKKKDRERDRILELHSRWAFQIENRYISYINNKEREDSEPKPIENIIKLTERNSKIIELMNQVWDCFPDVHSEEYHEEAADAHSDPKWNGGEFKKKLESYMVEVRKQYI